MRIKKILIRAAIVISVLLLIFKGFLMYRNSTSYKGVLHEDADKIVKISVDGIIKTIVYNAIKHPFYYSQNRKKDNDTIDDIEKPNKGFGIPATIFLYTIKGKSATTWFTSFKISDAEAFKNYLKNEHNISDFRSLKTLTIATNANQKISIAFSDTQCVVVYNPDKELIDSIFTDVLLESKTLNSGDTLMSKLKDSNAHLSYITQNNQLLVDFKDGEVIINGNLELTSDFKIPEENTYSQFSDGSSITFYLNLLTSKHYDCLTYKNSQIQPDSINAYYKGNFSIEMAEATTQKDTVVSYKYNDDFEKVETFKIVEKQVPELNMEWSSNASQLYHYLENASIIRDSKLKSELFPLYQFKIDTTKNRIYASTNLYKTSTASKTVNREIFALNVDFHKLLKQNHFPIINPYLEELSTLNLKGKKQGHKAIKVEGQIVLKNKSINSLAQFML